MVGKNVVVGVQTIANNKQTKKRHLVVRVAIVSACIGYIFGLTVSWFSWIEPLIKGTYK